MAVTVAPNARSTNSATRSVVGIGGPGDRFCVHAALLAGDAGRVTAATARATLRSRAKRAGLLQLPYIVG